MQGCQGALATSWSTSVQFPKEYSPLTNHAQVLQIDVYQLPFKKNEQTVGLCIMSYSYNSCCLPLNTSALLDFNLQVHYIKVPCVFTLLIFNLIWK